MDRPSITVRILMIVLAVAMLGASTGLAWAVTDDYLQRDIVPNGVTVSDHDLSGLSREQAATLIENEFAAPLLEPMELVYDGGSFTFDADAYLTVDVDGMVDDALDPRREATLAERVLSRLTGEGESAEVAPRLTVDEVALATYVEGLASQIDTEPANAHASVETTALVITPATTGYTLDVSAAVDTITQGLQAEDRTLELPVASEEATITEDSFGKAIVVVLSERKLYLYEGAAVVKTYGVAIGTPGHPTPTGEYVIELKRYMPTWVNPGSAWAANMPAYIPPGPSNPLGTRALNISAPGIRIHGTSADWSIGRAASHGCMRMHRWDIEDLYERVDVGTPVIIVR